MRGLIVLTTRTRVNTQRDEPLPDVDPGVMCGIAVQCGGGSFDDTLVCGRHGDDCTGCNKQTNKQTVRKVNKEKRWSGDIDSMLSLLFSYLHNTVGIHLNK